MSRFQQLFPDAEAIIFDLGNVIYNVDYGLTQKAFERLGIANFGELFSQAKQTGLFDTLETGTITPAAFRNDIRRLLPRRLTDRQIDDAWNAMLLDLPPARLALLAALRKEYRTFLLSNTNVIHLAAVAEHLQAAGIHSLDGYFEKAYYSSSIGLRKPDAASYLYVITENNLCVPKTVFIDDLPQNIEGAKSTGLKTYHLTGGETIIDLFAQ